MALKVIWANGSEDIMRLNMIKSEFSNNLNTDLGISPAWGWPLLKTIQLPRNDTRLLRWHGNFGGSTVRWVKRFHFLLADHPWQCLPVSNARTCQLDLVPSARKTIAPNYSHLRIMYKKSPFPNLKNWIEMVDSSRWYHHKTQALPRGFGLAYCSHGATWVSICHNCMALSVRSPAAQQSALAQPVIAELKP